MKRGQSETGRGGLGAPPRLVSLREAASQLGVSVMTTTRLIAARHLEAIKIGRKRLVVAESLDAYVARQRREQQPA